MSPKIDVRDPWSPKAPDGSSEATKIYPVKVEGVVFVVQVHDLVATAGKIYGNEMKQLVSDFVEIQLSKGWQPLLLDEGTARNIPGWSDKFK